MFALCDYPVREWHAVGHLQVSMPSRTRPAPPGCKLSRKHVSAIISPRSPWLAQASQWGATLVVVEFRGGAQNRLTRAWGTAEFQSPLTRTPVGWQPRLSTFHKDPVCVGASPCMWGCHFVYLRLHVSLSNSGTFRQPRIPRRANGGSSGFGVMTTGLE